MSYRVQHQENRKTASSDEARKCLKPHSQDVKTLGPAPAVTVTGHARGGQVGSEPRVVKYSPAFGWEEASVR